MSPNLPTCKRCRQRQDMPTYQYVKFDQSVHYLCDACWTQFRRWFHQRTAERRGAMSAG